MNYVLVCICLLNYYSVYMFGLVSSCGTPRFAPPCLPIINQVPSEQHQVLRGGGGHGAGGMVVMVGRAAGGGEGSGSVGRRE
jgi:hypothetical protein